MSVGSINESSFLPELESLLLPFSQDEFLQNFWPSEPFVTHGLEASVSALTNLPQLVSLDQLLQNWPKKVQAHLPDVKDESHSIDVEPQDAKKLFDSKMSLLFNNAEEVIPQLQIWLKDIKEKLGLPHSSYGRCLVYATPGGGGTTTHFDQNINFVLQLSGVKRWTLAQNQNVEHPTQRFTIGQEIDPELQSYAQLPMPTKMPSDSIDIILKKGSMLFVPRGYWHSTHAESDALALNFTFSQPSWADLLLLALRSRLNMSADWRQLADQVRSTDPTKRLHARKQLEILLLELSRDIPNWRAEDILAATEGD